jgi:hypothetical protein
MKIKKPNIGIKLFVAVMPWKGITTPNAAIITHAVAASGVFTSVQVKELKITIEQDETLTNEIPEVDETKLAKLGDDGIISIGQEVVFGDVLVGLTKIVHNSEDPADKLQRAIFGDNSVVKNCSEYMIFKDPGVVIGVEKGKSSIIIHVAIKRNVKKSDVLYDEKNREIVIVDIVSEQEMPHIKDVTKITGEKPQVIITSPSDVVNDLGIAYYTEEHQTMSVVYSLENPGFILLAPSKKAVKKPHTSKKWESKGESAAIGNIFLQKRERLIEQKIEVYGTNIALTYYKQLGEGVKFKPNFISALKKKGMLKTAEELLTYKSDHQKDYLNAVRSIIFGENLKSSNTDVESVFNFKMFLQALSFSFTTDGIQAKIESMTSGEVLTCSSGEVISSETVNYKKNLKPIPGGIMCEKVFGSTNDFSCHCGKFNSSRCKGTTCDKCGVIIDSSLRSKRFGHIVLAVPMVHPMSKGKVKQFMKCLSDDSSETHDLLEKMSLKQFVDHSMQVCSITGNEILHYLPILPPNLRPLQRIRNNEFATSDLNDLYRQLIIRNNRVARLMEIKAPCVILRNEVKMLQESIVSLIYGLGDLKGLLSHCVEFDNLLYSKRVRFSAKGISIPRVSLSISQCGLPLDSALTLFEPHIAKIMMKNDVELRSFKYVHSLILNKDSAALKALDEVLLNICVLVTNREQDRVYGFQPIITNEEAISFHPDAFAALDIKLESNPLVYIHAPLLADAQNEARGALFSGEKMNVVPHNPKNYSWVTPKDLSGILLGKAKEFTLSQLDKVLLKS